MNQHRRLHYKTRLALADNPLFETCPCCNEWVDTCDWGETDATEAWLLVWDAEDEIVWPLRAMHTDCHEAEETLVGVPDALGLLQGLRATRLEHRAYEARK